MRQRDSISEGMDMIGAITNLYAEATFPHASKCLISTQESTSELSNIVILTSLIYPLTEGLRRVNSFPKAIERFVYHLSCSVCLIFVFLKLSYLYNLFDAIFS